MCVLWGNVVTLTDAGRSLVATWLLLGALAAIGSDLRSAFTPQLPEVPAAGQVVTLGLWEVQGLQRTDLR